ncbi:MAG: hypothetical protein M1517_00950, partial [Deltaproteobacteria bacterium]|nr:hypothetical protein [Deltaproteobacteria bacterium]
MSMWSAVKRPAIAKLWLIRAIPVYLFVMLSFMAVRYGFKPYLQHKYPTIVKRQKFLFFDVGKKVYRDRWLSVYNKWDVHESP